MKRKKGELRSLAATAKARLVTGFWHEADDTDRHTETYNLYYGKTDHEEEQLYRTVAQILRSGENPLAHVLDRAHMDALDEHSRERYVLSIGARVRKCVERFNQVC